MKRIQLLLVIAAVIAATMMLAGCPKTPPPPPPEQPVVTEPVQEVDTTPTPPPEAPAPTLKETQFQTLYFDFDKYSLRSDAKSALDANYKLLTEFPDAMIKIEGHCDERGTVEYNLSLGEKRAKAAQDYLIGLGIAANRISIISYGKERPVDTGHNENAWAKNRRCEFRIVSQ